MKKPDGPKKARKHRDPECPYSTPFLRKGGPCKCKPKPTQT